MSLFHSQMRSRIHHHRRAAVWQVVQPLRPTRTSQWRHLLDRRLRLPASVQTQLLIHAMFNHHRLDRLQPSLINEPLLIPPTTLWLPHTTTIRTTTPRYGHRCQRFSPVQLRSEVLPSNMSLPLSQLRIDRWETRPSLLVSV
jgi:hypothetical protein